MYIVLKYDTFSEVYIKNLSQLQNHLIELLPLEILEKILKRLIKKEKWNCSLLLSLIIRISKGKMKDSNGGIASNYKEIALDLIKSIIKKKVWEIKSKSP